MAGQTRLFVFPGGILEIEAYGSEDDEEAGAYLEWFGCGDDGDGDDGDCKGE
ncbi:hypothetical protein [Nocardia sp. NPDC005825]|uniref:hypothetical protein n=1 Tax=Nocardia sp. NPDC005825 TaxID=3155452 RepID=UPI0034083EEE